MFKFTTIEEMKEKLIRARELTEELKALMTIQFPIEENNFNHLSTHKFHECIEMSQDWLEMIEKDLNEYKNTR